MPGYHVAQTNGQLESSETATASHSTTSHLCLGFPWSCRQPLQEQSVRSPGAGQQDASEGGCENQRTAGTWFLQLPHPCGKSDRRMEACHRLRITKQLRYHHEVPDENYRFSPGISPPRRLNVLCGSPGPLFSNPSPSGVLPISMLLPQELCLPVQGVVLHPVHGSAGLHQSLSSGFGVGASEGRAPSSLPGRLAGSCGVEGPPYSPSGPSSPVILQPRDCGHLEEIVPRPFDLSSVLQHDSRHDPRTDVSISRSSVTIPGGDHVLSPAPLSSSSCGSAFSTICRRWNGFFRGDTHMRPLQWQIKDHWWPVDGNPTHLSQDCVQSVR